MCLRYGLPKNCIFVIDPAVLGFGRIVLSANQITFLSWGHVNIVILSLESSWQRELEVSILIFQFFILTLRLLFLLYGSYCSFSWHIVTSACLRLFFYPYFSLAFPRHVPLSTLWCWVAPIFAFLSTQCFSIALLVLFPVVFIIKISSDNYVRHVQQNFVSGLILTSGNIDRG